MWFSSNDKKVKELENRVEVLEKRLETMVSLATNISSVVEKLAMCVNVLERKIRARNSDEKHFESSAKKEFIN
jgi:chaperonin cofactor prefoldin